MIAFSVLMFCMIYLIGTSGGHSFSELSNLDVGVVIVAIISFVRMLFWLSDTGGGTSCSNRRW